MKVRSLVIAVLAAMTFSAASIAGPKTTGPGQHVSILVELTDHGLFVYDQAQMARGAIVTFNVFNIGKKPHNFSLLGKKTRAVAPKTGKRTHWRHMTVTLLTRGRFPCGSTLDKGPAFHGFFTVY